MAQPISMDKERVSFNLARLKKEGQSFEIAVEPDPAIAYKKGAKIDIKDVVRSDNIFHDVKKGQLASENTLKELFETDDTYEIASRIIKEGEIQLTTEYRAQLREQKRKRILAIVHRNAIDPSTNLPHPMARIESAFEESKCHIDEFESAEMQVDKVVKSLRIILPLKIEVRKVQLHIPAQYAHQTFRMIKEYGNNRKETWGDDGALTVQMEVPAGLQEEMLDKLNNATHGSVELEVLSK